MTEFTGMAYFAEIPVVIWDIQRMGPSTGLPTRTSQGDVNLCYFLGHGDTKHVVLFPASVNECFEFGWKSFDLAEHLQTPVFVLSDLDLGINQWMSKPFDASALVEPAVSEKVDQLTRMALPGDDQHLPDARLLEQLERVVDHRPAADGGPVLVRHTRQLARGGSPRRPRR